MKKWSNLKLFVVAGNYEEFQDFVIRKRMKGFTYDFVYVSGAEMLRGMTTIRGFYIGTYREREDWPIIRDLIAIIKVKENALQDDLTDVPS
jgi:hypothetical protein